jgi:hypothetical protein
LGPEGKGLEGAEVTYEQDFIEEVTDLGVDCDFWEESIEPVQTIVRLTAFGSPKRRKAIYSLIESLLC